MFIDASTIAPIIEAHDDIVDLIPKIESYKSAIKFAESAMNIWSEGFFSSNYQRGQYTQAKKEKEEAESNLNKSTQKLNNLIDNLKDYASKYYYGEFSGWVAYHKFKSLNGEGSISIPSEMIFFFDENFTTCNGYEVDTMMTLTDLIEAVNNATSDDDIIDYFKNE